MDFDEVKKSLLGRRDIRKKKDITFGDMPLEIRQIGALGIEMYRDYANSDKPEIKHLARAALIQMCLYHKESGKRVFEEDEIRDIMNGYTGPEIDELYFECLRINGYMPDSKIEILKNLLMTLGDSGLVELQEIIDARLQSFSKDTPATKLSNSGS